MLEIIILFGREIKVKIVCIFITLKNKMILKTREFIIKQNNMSLRNINEYVTKFIAGKPELVEAWQDVVNQDSLNKMLGGGKERKERGVKDKDRPRKMSAYLHFCKENRETVKKSMGETAKNTDITTELGKRWNDIKGDASKVKKYSDLAEKDAESFKEKMKDYKPSVGAPVKVKREKKQGGAARGKSAYLFFCSDNRDKVKADLGEKSTPTAVTTELGKRWNILKEDTSKDAKAMIVSYTAKAEASKKEVKQEVKKEVKQEVKKEVKQEVKKEKKDVKTKVVEPEEVLEDEDEDDEPEVVAPKKVVVPKEKTAPKEKSKKTK